LKLLTFSVLSGILLLGIIGNSQLVYGEKFVIDDYDFELTGAFSEIFSIELFPGAWAGTGGTFESDCTDGVDNDGDGLTDFDDPDCFESPPFPNGNEGNGNHATTPVGGEFISLDATSVLVAGSQMTLAWMIPVIVSGIGIAIVIARKF